MAIMRQKDLRLCQSEIICEVPEFDLFLFLLFNPNPYSLARPLAVEAKENEATTCFSR